MEINSPSSSDHAPAAPDSLTAEPGPLQEKLDALGEDEPLPEVYAGDQINLLVQTPERLFLYWNHARDPFDTLRTAFGESADGYRLCVRLTDVASGRSSLLPVEGYTREFWFNDVEPNHEYRADVGLTANGRPFIRLLSAGARTPRADVAPPEPDRASRLHFPEPDFDRLLEEAGYAPDDGAAPEPEADEEEWDELEGGELEEEEEFEAEEEGRPVWGASDVTMGPGGRRLLRSRRPPHARRQKRAGEGRPAFGASEVAMRPPRRRRWAPSMTAGRLTTNDE